MGLLVEGFGMSDPWASAYIENGFLITNKKSENCEKLRKWRRLWTSSIPPVQPAVTTSHLPSMTGITLGALPPSAFAHQLP